MELKFRFQPLRYDFYGGDVNTYLLETENNVYLIDAAVVSAKAFIEENLKQAVADSKKLHILNTHFHWDHSSLNGYFRNQYHADIAAHEKAAMLCDPEKQFQIVYGDYLDTHPTADSIYDLYMQEFAYPSAADRFLRDGDIIEDGGMKLHVLETPGHSEDSISFYEENSGYLFAGDAVQGKGFDGNAPFYRDAAAYRNSILRMKQLHPVKIFCGHGLVEGQEACEAFLQDSLDMYDRIQAAILTSPAQSPVEIATSLAQQLNYPNSVHIYTTTKAHLNTLNPK